MAEMLMETIEEGSNWKMVKGGDNISRVEQSNLKLHEIVCDFIERLMVLSINHY